MLLFVVDLCVIQKGDTDDVFGVLIIVVSVSSVSCSKFF